MNTLNTLRHQVIAIAKQAGQLLVDAENIEIMNKEGHANYVTNVDLAAQTLLITELTPLLDADFMAEEDETPHTWNKDYTWIIDPLDGTTNFMRNFHHSCISIALAYKQQIVLGVVHNPYLNETFQAIRDDGSYCNDTKLQVTSKPMNEALIIFGTALYDLSDADITFHTAKQIFLQCGDLRRTGSAALDLCYVAAGRCDGFFEYRLSPWDYAAGSLIIQEAGGHIDGIQKPFTVMERIGIIAGNHNVFPALRKQVDEDQK